MFFNFAKRLPRWEWLMLLSLYFDDVLMFVFWQKTITVFYGRSYCQCGWCYCHLLIEILLADVIANVMADVIANDLWLMLLPYVADVIATYWLLLCWLMLLPMYNGWCFYHRWQMEWPLLCDGLMLLPCGRWYSHLVGMWADVICPSGRWNDHWVNYFGVSSLLLLRTSSHMWGRWYLPMFLFRDGPLTLMYMDSLISLERFCSSLPTTLKFSSVVVWPEVLLWSWMGEGAFRCSLNLSPNVLDVSPMYSSSHSNLSHLNL